MKKLLFIIGTILITSCKSIINKHTEVQSGTSNPTSFVVKSAVLSKGKLIRIARFPSRKITPRPVDVWLPATYSKDKKYAVLYMHDGQMLFDSTTTWNKQEWNVDEWATRLVDEKQVKDFIVVAIHNIPQMRWQDLFPEKAIGYISKDKSTLQKSISGKPVTIKDFNGDKYLEFMVEELKPLIDKTYAVHTDRENTFVMGSSMGGLMSMYAISEYPNVFGAAACLSTHWVGALPIENNPYPESIFKYMEHNLPKAGSHKLYFDYGNKTLDQHYPQYAPRVNRILKSKGYTETDSKNLFFEGTDHSENSWNQRLDQPLVFLLSN
jgi:predicted alpha/beta superfamily hydrolase